MRKLCQLLSVLFFIYWGCEEEIPITCISTDNEGVEKVELWVNGVSTGVTDETETYSLE